MIPKLIHFFTTTKLDIMRNVEYKFYVELTVKQMLQSSPLAIELHQHGMHFR